MLNSCTAAIAGMHKEEVLARLAAHDAPISFLPLDYLCGLLHQTLRAAVPSGPAAARTHTDVMHLRMARIGGGRGSELVRMEVVKLFNAQGQVTQVLRLDAPNKRSNNTSCLKKWSYKIRHYSRYQMQCEHNHIVHAYKPSHGRSGAIVHLRAYWYHVIRFAGGGPASSFLPRMFSFPSRDRAAHHLAAPRRRCGT